MVQNIIVHLISEAQGVNIFVVFLGFYKLYSIWNDSLSSQ